MAGNGERPGNSLGAELTRMGETASGMQHAIKRYRGDAPNALVLRAVLEHLASVTNVVGSLAQWVVREEAIRDLEHGVTHDDG